MEAEDWNMIDGGRVIEELEDIRLYVDAYRYRGLQESYARQGARVQELLNSEYELKKKHLLEMERALRMKDDLIRYFSGDPAYDWDFLMEAFGIPEPIATELWDRAVKRVEERGL